MSAWNSDLQTKLEQLLIAVLEGEPTDANRLALNELLHEHAEARDLYIRSMALHAQLRQRHAHQAAPDSPTPVTGSKARTIQWERLKRFATRPTPLSLATAFIAVACMLGLLAVIAPPIYRAVRGAGDLPVTRPAPVLAEVVGTHEASLASGDLQRGNRLRAGQQLRLERGLLEIHYLTGEQIVLEGPALFTLAAHPTRKNCGLGQLEAGKLVAQVPAAAVGFSIETPTATIVDLGTQFCVSVSDTGTEVLVLQGKVLAHAADDRNAGQEIAITAGHSYRFEPQRAAPRSIALAESTFQIALPGGDRQRDPYTAAVLTDRPVGYWRLNERSTSVALNSAGRPLGMYHGDVTQGADPRPGSEEQTENRRSARFDGVNDYVEIEHRTELNAEDFTLEAWVKLDRVPSDYASVITSRDAPRRMAGYILYVSPQGTWEFWTGQGADWSRVEGPSARVGQWTHIAATYQRIRTHTDGVTSGIACLFVNGQLVAKQEAMRYRPLQEYSRPLRIGAGRTEQASPDYFFPGQVADVAVYDRALEMQDIRAHFGSTIASEGERR